jgi:threonine/homoserine/homoserine lactone efflux protein
MVTIQAALGIGGVALALVLTPGPNMIYLVSRSVLQGRRAGLVSLLGVGVGFFIYLVAAATGIATLFALVPQIYLAIKIAGAAYLLWLAWKAIKPGGESAFSPDKGLAEDPPRKLFLMGLATNLLNPKIAVLYISLLPQFVDPERGNVAGQGLELGLVQISVALTVNALIVLTAGSVSSFLTSRPAWLRAQRYAMGVVLTGLAVNLMLDRPRISMASR